MLVVRTIKFTMGPKKAGQFFVVGNLIYIRPGRSHFSLPVLWGCGSPSGTVCAVLRVFISQQVGGCSPFVSAATWNNASPAFHMLSRRSDTDKSRYVPSTTLYHQQFYNLCHNNADPYYITTYYILYLAFNLTRVIKNFVVIVSFLRKSHLNPLL